MGRFDRFADWTEEHVAQAWFFVFCLALVLLWLPSYFLFGKVDTWQLVINTVTTVVTFLLVALLQNTQRRFELSVHEKLDAIAVAVGQSQAVGRENEISSSSRPSSKRGE